MSLNETILSTIAHRPNALPLGRWQYYQEWNDALFFHWAVSYDSLRPLVPSSLELDNIGGSYYISLVAFRMEKIRPRLLPAVTFISNFDEINIRTYVLSGQIKGVYFLNIEAGSVLSTFIAKLLSSLPYTFSKIKRSNSLYSSTSPKKNYSFSAEFKIKDKINTKSNLDLWLTERYALFGVHHRTYFRYDIHHIPWPLHQLQVKNLSVQYADIHSRLADIPDLMHYSSGVKIFAWPKVIL